MSANYSRPCYTRLSCRGREEAQPGHRLQTALTTFRDDAEWWLNENYGHFRGRCADCCCDRELLLCVHAAARFAADPSTAPRPATTPSPARPMAGSTLNSLKFPSHDSLSSPRPMPPAAGARFRNGLVPPHQRSVPDGVPRAGAGAVVHRRWGAQSPVRPPTPRTRATSSPWTGYDGKARPIS